MKVKVLGGICIALGLALAAAGFEVISANKALTDASQQSTKLSLQVELLQSNVADLTLRIEQADSYVVQLNKERALIDSLHQQQLTERAKLQAELVTAKAAVNNLRQSHDQYVKAWADARVPNAAVRLLKYSASASQDSSAASADLSHTARVTAERLSAKYNF